MQQPPGYPPAGPPGFPPPGPGYPPAGGGFPPDPGYPAGYPGGYGGGGFQPGRGGASLYGFSVGNVLSRSFSIWGKNFVPFYLMTGVIQLPVLALTVYIASIGQEEMAKDLTQMGILMGALLIGALLFAPLATASVAYGVLQQLRGRHATISDCFRVGMSRALAVLGVAIVAGFVTSLGYMLCCVPGLFLATAYFVAAPAAVVERRGVFGSLQRSWQLTENTRWPVFGLIIVLAVIQIVVQQVVNFPAAELEGGAAIVLAVISALISVGIDSLKAVTGAVAYHDLRTEKEGANSQDLAAVFD